MHHAAVHPSPGASRPDAPDRPAPGRSRSRALSGLAAVLVVLVLTALMPLRPAGAADEPVHDTRDGEAPYLTVSFPEDVDETTFLGSVPMTVETNEYLDPWYSDIWVRTNPWRGTHSVWAVAAAKHTYDLTTGLTGNGETWISWDLVSRNGVHYTGSKPVQIQQAFDDPITWEVPGSSWWSAVPQGVRIEAKYTCNDRPGFEVVSCGWKGPGTHYLPNERSGQSYVSGHMRVRDLATGMEYDEQWERIFQVGSPQPLTVDVALEQQSWQTGEWMPVPDTLKVVEGTPVRAVATVSNTTDEERSVELHFGTTRPNTSGGDADQSYDIPGAAANFDLDADEMHVERYELSPELLRAWNEDGTANMKPRPIFAEATTGGDSGGDSAEVVTVPRPVILAHGYKSNAASSWGEYQSIMARSHPNLRGYAVGDGMFPGVMNTGSEAHPFTRTNTIAENAAQEATYIDAVRKETNAWNVDIVAHSMGGLISRYYVQELMGTTPTGANVVNRLIQLGTPNRGSQLADVLLSVGAVSPKAIPLYPATLQLSTGYIDDIYNKLVTDMRGVPISNLVGTELPLAGLPQFMELWGDGIVPEYSARWNLEDTFTSPRDLHTAMTENVDDFTRYVLPRLRQTTAPGTARAEHVDMSATDGERVTTQTTVVDPGCDDCDPDGDPIEWADPAVDGVHELHLPAGEVVTIPFTVGELWGVGALTADSDLRLELVHPDGTVRATSSSSARDPFATVAAQHPDSGTWQVRVTNPTGTDRDTVVALFVAGSPLKVDVETRMRPDGTSLVEATVTNRTRPLAGATVEATVTDGTPGDVQSAAIADVTLDLVDDGSQGDRAAGDGIYSALSPMLPEGAERTVAVRTTSSAGNRFSVGAVAGVPTDLPEERFDLTVETNGEGTVTVDPQQDDYAAGDVVSLSAAAADGWDFVRWYVDGAPVQEGGDLTLAIEADTQVTASFAEEPEVPLNQAPLIDLAATASVVEGSELRIAGSFVDADSSAWTATVDLGDGKGAQPLQLQGTNLEIRAIYPQDGFRTVTVTVDDGEGTSSATVAVDVTNAAPVATLTGQATRPATVGAPVQLTGTLTDAGVQDTHTAMFAVGTGTGAVQVPATITRTGDGAATVATTHTFTAAGTYPVTLTVTDDAGATSLADRVGTTVATVVVSAVPSQTPKDRLLTDFDALVTQHKVKASTAKALRTIVAAAADYHAKGNKLGVTMAMASFDLAVALARLIKEVTPAQATALQAFSSQVKSTLR